MLHPENLIIPINVLNDDLPKRNNVTVSMLRLDMIHPIVSGNKLFKLHYFLEEAKKTSHKKIITFGGAYSNHLAAAAFACKEAGIQSIGIVRGEKPKILSHTLLYCLQQDMQLEFISRNLYKNINDKIFLKELTNKYGSYILIPEGGFSIKGRDGANLICNYYNEDNFTHVCCAVGSATTIAGLLNGNKNEINIMGFSALKNQIDPEDRLALLNTVSLKKFSLFNDYHFGGYAKKNETLISFMNTFFNHNKIPLDFVYTGKMMFGVYDLIKKNYFEPGSKILCIHTGGLQGNDSLPKGLLNF